MLYFIVPGALIGGIIYSSWWEETPEWAGAVPFELFFLIPFFYILTGYFRTGLLDADQVFLVKHQGIFLRLKKWGILSTYFTTVLMTGGIGLLTAPFWLNHFDTGFITFFLYNLFILSSKWSHAAVKGMLMGLQKDWRRTGLFILSIIVQLQLWGTALRLITNGYDLLLVVIILILMFISFKMNIRRIYSKNSMRRDLQIESKLKMKWIALIFMFSFHVEKEPVHSERNRPRLFSKSQLIFKTRSPYKGFLEFFMKVMLRNFSYSALYLQSLGTLSFSQIVLPPLWLKLVAAALIAFSILAWNEWVWNKLIASHPIGSKYKNQLELMKARSTTRIAAFIPYLLIMLISFLHYLKVL